MPGGAADFVPGETRTFPVYLTNRALWTALQVLNERAALAPEEERGPALRPVVVPHLVAGVVGDRVADAQALERGRQRVALGGEAEARRVDADRGETRLPVALVPADRVRQRANAVELREVEEMDERRPARGEHGHRLGRLADPGDFLRQVRGGDVVSVGTHPRTLS